MKRLFASYLVCFCIVPALYAQELGENQLAETAIREAVTELIASVRAETSADERMEALFAPRTGVEDVDLTGSVVTVVFNDSFSHRSWTEESAEELLLALRAKLQGIAPAGAEIQVSIEFQGTRYPFETLITSPAGLRARAAERQVPRTTLAAPLVERVDFAGPTPAAGLAGRHFAIGASHGWTWHKENRWQFQRARLFTIIEDIYPMSYVNPFIIPMLENAGALVFCMRERDLQQAEAIVDNDGIERRDGTIELGDGSELRLTGEWREGVGRGWRGGVPTALDERTEPFTLGTTLEATAVSAADSDTTSPAALFVPYIPRAGKYSVYVSWAASADNSPSVPVTVRHRGGETTFRVNQQVAGNTWVFLGFFEFDATDFEAGLNAPQGSVSISTVGAEPAGDGPARISIDAVRFGGGMGNIAPGDLVSGKARYQESARYWAQYAGAPADMVYLRSVGPGHFGVDYNRDITARGEWPNYINGAPNGPNDYRATAGLGVPIDAALAFHTDAGIDADGLTGTLLLWRLSDEERSERFPDGRSRWMSRDLGSLMQDEIVRTARELYTSEWPAREISDRGFGEIRRPNMPSVILELLSHQNFNDMKYGLDPRWKRDISRAIYKSLLRFTAWSEGFEPVVAPLQPRHLAAHHIGGGTVELLWQAQSDALEPTAEPEGFIVYRSTDGRSFDNGRFAPEDSFRLDGLEADRNHYFRVTAVNAGGESLPSRVVGVRWSEGKQPALLVDGFDRICGPRIVDEPGARGFDIVTDPGVGYHYHYGVVGPQYDFDPQSDWKNDLETPGWGGSRSNLEDRIRLGNTFDHIVPHGAALAEVSMPFDSMTNDAFEAGVLTDKQWPAIDWIAGLQRTTPPPEGITREGEPDRMATEFQVLTEGARYRLRSHVAGGGGLLISGAYIAEDLLAGPLADDSSRAFAREILGVSGFEADATNLNVAVANPASPTFSDFGTCRFGIDLEPRINLLPTVYEVPSAEALTSIGQETAGILVFGDSRKTAALAGPRIAFFGFPLESVMPPAKRHDLIARGLNQVLRAEP